jgi:hypothetical protein
MPHAGVGSSYETGQAGSNETVSSQAGWVEGPPAKRQRTSMTQLTEGAQGISTAVPGITGGTATGRGAGGTDVRPNQASTAMAAQAEQATSQQPSQLQQSIPGSTAVLAAGKAVRIAIRLLARLLVEEEGLDVGDLLLLKKTGRNADTPCGCFTVCRMQRRELGQLWGRPGTGR